MVGRPRPLDDCAAQEEDCRVRYTGDHIWIDGGKRIPVEECRAIYGLFTPGVYDLPGRHRAYLPASSYSFCRTIDIYLWHYLFYT